MKNGGFFGWTIWDILMKHWRFIADLQLGRSSIELVGLSMAMFDYRRVGEVFLLDFQCISMANPRTKILNSKNISTVEMCLRFLTLTCYLSRMFLMFVDSPFFPRIDFSVNTFRSWVPPLMAHPQGLFCLFPDMQNLNHLLSVCMCSKWKYPYC